MKNPNALIAMAQVSQNANNPFSIFCEYIKFCVFSHSNNIMSLKEIRTAVSEEFGLYLPNNIALECLSRISQEGLIEQYDYQFHRIGEFNTKGFIETRDNHRAIEQKLIEELVKYMSQYDREWSFDYAREQLIKVLDFNGLAYDIFIHKSITSATNENKENTSKTNELLLYDEEYPDGENENQPLFTDSNFVGRFIEHILAKNDIYKNYLLSVCEGMMVCIGAYQLPAADSGSYFPQIKGTDFYFDTKLLLRVIGCAGEAAVMASKELVSLIQDAGGNICYYPQTFQEMCRAFDKASYSISNGYPPIDNEMRLFVSSISNNKTILEAKKANLEKELENLKIYPRPNNSFSERERIKCGFDNKILEQYMLNELSWEADTIKNDALSIWETHMRRSCNYKEYCGTNDRLCVFVTTNSKLIGIALGFREKHQNICSIQDWKQNRLPVITDVRLTCRLWSPGAQSERMSLLYLTSNAIAAQRPTPGYFNTIRQLAIDLEKNVPEYSGINLPAFFDDKITNIVFDKTKGNPDNLSIGSLASSIDEYSQLKIKEEKEKNSEIISERDKISLLLNQQTENIISGAVVANEKLGLLNFELCLILNTPDLIALILTLISAVVTFVTQNWSLLPLVLMAGLFFVVEHFIASVFLRNYCLNFSSCELKNLSKNVLRKISE